MLTHIMHEEEKEGYCKLWLANKTNHVLPLPDRCHNYAGRFLKCTMCIVCIVLWGSDHMPLYLCQCVCVAEAQVVRRMAGISFLMSTTACICRESATVSLMAGTCCIACFDCAVLVAES